MFKVLFIYILLGLIATLIFSLIYGDEGLHKFFSGKENWGNEHAILIAFWPIVIFVILQFCMIYRVGNLFKKIWGNKDDD